VLDADAVSRELTGENGKALPLIRKCFGESVFMGAQLNRAVMRQLVFADSSARQDLENMMLPLIMEEIQNRQLLYQQQPYGVIEIPLLQEKKEFQTLVQHVLLIDADESIRIHRVMARSNLSESEVRKIIAAQSENSSRYWMANEIILNNGNKDELTHKIGRLNQYYQSCFNG
jgi:dephospho-coA kinase